MSRVRSSSKSDRVRALPWAVALQGAIVLNRHWRKLSSKERSRATRLLKESGGRLGNLTSNERAELRRLAGKLDVLGVGRELLPIARGRARRGGVK
ncbi:MAG TPA: hypothetical protein VH025_00440 [Solirubrobacteraceae bacterium]|jgi:hypothetical protein|nr:hypothetical protein [Solirubrobacteraceae bacterium]